MTINTKLIIVIVALAIGLFVGNRLIGGPSPKSAAPILVPSPAATSLPVEATTSRTLCVTPAITTDIGRDEYPVDPKYGRLGFLGQLFTAADCGPERVKKIFGVQNDRYILGSTLRFTHEAPLDLGLALQKSNFKCIEGLDDACLAFRLSDEIPLSLLLELRYAIVPYADLIESDDCVNCG